MKVRIRTLVTSALVALALCLFSLVQSTSAVNDCKKVEGRYKSLFRWRKRCGSPNHKFVNASEHNLRSIPASLWFYRGMERQPHATKSVFGRSSSLLGSNLRITQI